MSPLNKDEIIDIIRKRRTPKIGYVDVGFVESWKKPGTYFTTGLDGCLGVVIAGPGGIALAHFLPQKSLDENGSGWNDWETLKEEAGKLGDGLKVFLFAYMLFGKYQYPSQAEGFAERITKLGHRCDIIPYGYMKDYKTEDEIYKDLEEDDSVSRKKLEFLMGTLLVKINEYGGPEIYIEGIDQLNITDASRNFCHHTHKKFVPYGTKS